MWMQCIIIIPNWYKCSANSFEIYDVEQINPVFYNTDCFFSATLRPIGTATLCLGKYDLMCEIAWKFDEMEYIYIYISHQCDRNLV